MGYCAVVLVVLLLIAVVDCDGRGTAACPFIVECSLLKRGGNGMSIPTSKQYPTMTQSL